MWLIDDPLQLSQKQMILPYPLAKMISEMDGTKTLDALYRLLSAESDSPVSFTIVTDALAQLDENFLLENSFSSAKVADIEQAWREQPFRPPVFAGQTYPDDPAKLDQTLAAYSVGDDDLANWSEWAGRAIVAPHIDYQRGGHVYAKTWQRAKKGLESADLILIWGTDHKGGAGSLTLSSIPYATPYGILPTDDHIVRELAAAIGEDAAYELELNHRTEHSIELAATWLHYLRRESCPVLPILVGSFYHFTPNGDPLSDPKIATFMRRLKELTAGKKVFSVASVDLAHVGPAFDSPYEMDERRKQHLRQTDAQLLGAIERGDKERWFDLLAYNRNANNVCGFAPTYLMLDYLGETSGARVGYEQCSADPADTSIVSIGGVLLN